jgi:sugar/nucleoside kinase (ribokinase family)
MIEHRAKSMELRDKRKGRRAKSKEKEALSSKLYALCSMPPEFVAIGHFTQDIVEGGPILGGAAAYSSIAARQLGLRAGAVSAVGENFLHYEKLEGISLALVENSTYNLTTTFQNTYEEGIGRRQIIRSVSAPIRSEHIPSEWLCAEIVYLCPVADEVDPSIVHKFPDSLMGISPQGWMRQWNDEGHVSPRKWEAASDVLPHVDVTIMSEEDISPFPDIVREYVDLAEVMVLTRGGKGSTLFHKDQIIDFPAFRTRTVDPTGAGDVFAVAFLKEFHETRDLCKASVFANCVASFVVEKQGIEGIPDLDHVHSRMMYLPS